MELAKKYFDGLQEYLTESAKKELAFTTGATEEALLKLKQAYPRLPSITS